MHLDEHQFEQAAKIEQRTRDESIAAARQRNHEEQEYDGAGQIVCRGCGDPLSPKRLEAQPNAARCVDCESLRERWGQ